MQDVQQAVDRFTEDMLYVDQHREELLARYPEQWVAVWEKEVVAAADSIEELVSKLKRQGLEPGHIYREFLTEREENLILVGAGA